MKLEVEENINVVLQYKDRNESNENCGENKEIMIKMAIKF
jgi:hypothetical protein